MGKRSNMQRVDKDFYPTPYEAVVPLLPHLDAGTRFDEMCVGAFDLMAHLELEGHTCSRHNDITHATGFDALAVTACWGDVFITNPPYAWGILEDLMVNFYNIAPTWLLLPADMMHNKRMGKHMKHCLKVASIGRVKWFGNQTGMENSAWYLFDANQLNDTRFYGR